MKSVVLVTLAIGIAIGAAPTASADQSQYLARLVPEFAGLTPTQLLTEGYKVCRYVSTGRPTGDAIPMVTKDLGVTVSAAFDIVPAAVEELTC
jgi:hypothetical protein